MRTGGAGLALCLFLMAGASGTGHLSGQTPPPSPLAQADEFYRHREDLASAQKAVALYDQQAASSFEAAWKLARAYYWLATAGPQKDRGTARDRGVKAAELAVKLDPSKPDGHFWLALMLGEAGDNASVFTQWKYPNRIKTELDRVYAIDKAWQEGSADRALGEWYFRVPATMGFGGDRKKAEEHLRAALRYNPKSISSLEFLGEIIAADKTRKDEARTVLRQALEAPVDPDWAPEDRQFLAKAAALLSKLTNGKN